MTTSYNRCGTMVMKRTIGYINICVIMMLALVAPLKGATAQSNTWMKPLEISGTSESSWFPDITTGPEDSVHIVWASGFVRGKEQLDQVDLLFYRVFKDGQWSKSNDITNPGNEGAANRSSIVIGRDGHLHLLVRSRLRINYLQAPWDRALSVQDWSTPRKINNMSTPYYDVLTLDSKNTLHAFWNESVSDDPKAPRKDCPNCSDLFYRRSSDHGNTWSAPVNLSQTPEGSAKPQVKIDRNDWIHAVWDEGFDTIVGKGEPVASVYRRSRDGGRTWEPLVRFTLPPYIPPKTGEEQPESEPDAPQQIALGLFQNQSPIVVYRSTASDTIYYQFSEDGGMAWSKAAPLPGVSARYINDTPWDSYTMATDGSGKVHLIFSGFLPSDSDPSLELRPTDQRNRPRLLHVVWDGRSWSAPEVVAAEDRYPDWSATVLATCDNISPGSAQARTDSAQTALKKCQQLERYPEWPRAVISGGNKLHLTWFTRSNNDIFDSDHSHYQVWYSVKQLDAPALAALPLFTPVPTAAPQVATATPLPPTATPLPPSITNAPLADGPAAWEGPGVVTMALAALPAIGLLGLIVGARALLVRGRRRMN
jgi:hypothetical protein